MTLTIGLAAPVALLPADAALADSTPSSPAAAPMTSTATTTVAAPTPPAAGVEPASSPTESAAPTTQGTATTPLPAPEAVRQRSQPATREPAAHRGAPGLAAHGVEPSAPSGAKVTVKPPPHGLSITPGALTPALPPSLAEWMGGVPSFFINSFSIPPFLLPIYQAAGAAYGIPWQVLAAINEVETDYGRDLSVSGAGAEGWMQFLPNEWSQFGVDVNNDGFEDPYNPADAIFAAARYLKDAGGDRDIRAAVFAYNHSQSYVQSVMLRARLLGGTPPALLGAVTGLSEARFPVYAPSHYSDGFPTRSTGGTLVGTTIYSQAGAPAIAVQDGRIVRIGHSSTLGAYVSLRDAYGNAYTYGQLGALATLYPVLEGPKRFSLHPLRVGVHVIAGTVLGHLSSGPTRQPQMLFQIRPAGTGAPLIDPKPILDGWVKLEDSSAVRARGSTPPGASPPTPGQALLESKAQLEREIARERKMRIALCERHLISDGRVDRRVLAVLQFLASSGFDPTVSASSCGASSHSLIAGAPSPAGGGAIDISAIDGVAVADPRGGGSPAVVAAVRRLLGLQGTMRPLEIAGPAGLPKAANVLVLPGRPNRIHISFGLSTGSGARAASALSAGLSPAQWVRLIARLGQIPDPAVAAKPSPAAIPDARSGRSAAGGQR
jgi:hypothetical protein